MLTSLVDFDVKTLLGVLVWGYLAGGVIVCLYKSSSRDRQTSVIFNTLMFTRFLYAAGFFLIFLEDAVPAPVSVNIGFSLLYICIYLDTGLSLKASKIYSPKKHLFATASLLISVLAFNIFEFYNENPLWRYSLSSIIIIYLCMIPCSLLLFSKQTNEFAKKVSIFYYLLFCALVPRIIAPFLGDSLSLQTYKYFQCLALVTFIIMMAISTAVILLFIRKWTDSHIKHFHTVISSVDAGVIVVDENFAITDFNLAAEKILGYKPYEVLGRTPKYHTPDEYHPAIDEVREHMRKGNYVSDNEVVQKHKDGRLLCCSASLFPILDEKGRVGGSVVILRDITEKKRMERALEETARAAEEASRAKAMFLANMSHEIRTPLNGVIGFAELVLDDEDIPDKTKEYLNKIKNSAESLLDIVNNILDISKIESNKMELEKTPFDLQAVLHACKTIIEPKAREKGLSLFFYSESLAGKKLVGDPAKLRQALLNLLSNAVKFTSRGMVEVKVEIDKETSQSTTLRFEIKDSGIGMNHEQIRKVFDDFALGDVGTRDGYGGTALRLGKTKNFVEMMGGALLVESAPGLGCKFHFTLSFDTVADMGETPYPAEAPPVLTKPIFSGEVLVCEDNHINQEVITNYLSRVGLKATVAENGKEGLKYARERQEKGNPYDLILMDIFMPVMDGLEAARKMTEMGNKTPIVALTANALITDRETYIEAGMVDCMSKPFTAQDLWGCLLKYLKPAAPEKREAEDGESTVDYVLNEELGLKRTSDDPQLYMRITKNFVKDYADVMNKLNELIDSGDARSAHRMAHSLKGNARTIGAEKLANAAREVESALSSGSGRLAENLEVLDGALKELLQRLGPAPDEPVMKKSENLDVDEALAFIETLGPLLSAGYVESMDYLEKARQTFSSLGPEGGKLAAQMEDYEFEAAFKTLTGLKKLLMEPGGSKSGQDA